MSKKQKDKLTVVDAEFSSRGTAAPVEVQVVDPQINEERNKVLTLTLDTILKQHQEKGSMAFEILKSVISQKTDLIAYKHTDFSALVSGAYELADLFKQEMDARYTKDVSEARDKILGIKKEKETTEIITKDPKTIN